MRKNANKSKKRPRPEAQVIYQDQWSSKRKLPLGTRLGLYEPLPMGAPSSTRQQEASLLAVAPAPTTHKGLIFGINPDTGWPVIHDPFAAYDDPRTGVTNANCAFIGDIGKAKSSGIKTWGILRPLLMGRNCVVVDKKYQKNTGEGEYAPLCRLLGKEPIVMSVARRDENGSLIATGSCINVLDPSITVTTSGDTSPASQMTLLRTISQEALGRELTPKEGEALNVAHDRTLQDCKAEGRVPTIRILLDRLLNPVEGDSASSRITAAELFEWGLDLALALKRMVDSDLAGLIDGETSENIELGDGLTVFDVSRLPESGPALSIVMVVINTWLTNRIASRPNSISTYFIIEEAWHLVRGSVATVIERNMKLSRGLGLGCIFAFHHYSDVPPGSPAQAILKECDTIVLYGQKRKSDAQAVVENYDLPPSFYRDILTQPTGTAKLKIGTLPPITAQHLRSPLEVTLTNTDAAMKLKKVNLAEVLDLESAA
ncbi:UNVERIFIED_CONTAM: ATP/GTP-binding protein [Actinomycetes bacterium ARC8]|nr:ATP/GTP-binding protein [Actinomycetes bacterium ARC8]